MWKAPHRCHNCQGTLVFLCFDPEPGDSQPTFVCVECRTMHLTRNCCWEKPPSLDSWTNWRNRGHKPNKEE